MTTDATTTADVPASLAEALAAFQANLPKVAKDKTGTVRSDKGTYQWSYADLANVSEVALPLLARYGLAWSTMPTLDGERFVLRYHLMHGPSGESISGLYPLPSGGSPQAMGSAISYARRYALCAVTGIAADKDDDAQAAEAEHQTRRGRHGGRPVRPARRSPQQSEPEPEPSLETRAQRNRQAAQMLDQILSAETREEAVRLWKLTKNSSFADVDVSGLLDDHTRACLEVESGQQISIQQIAARSGKFVKENGRAVKPTAPHVAADAAGEAGRPDDEDAGYEAEQEAADDPAGFEQ